MKKTTKKSPMMKIVSAAAMLAVSASMLATSTYAWFSLNTTVKATSMAVTAKSDNVFLQIVNSNSDATNAAKTAATAVAAATEIKPVEYTAISAGGVVSWGQTFSLDPSDPNYTAKANLTPVAVADVDDYVWHDTFTISVAENANDNVGEELVLTSVSVTNTGDSNVAEALRILVVGEDGAMFWYNTGASENGTALAGGISTVNYKSSSPAPTYLAEEVDDSGTAIAVYIYYCGNDDTVTTEDAQSLTAISVELTFDVNAIA